jgi:hypothetical protein
METFDAVTLFFSGVSLGIIIGHWLCKRTDVQLAYERGKAAAIVELWPYVVRGCIADIRGRRVANAGSETNGGSDSD